LIRLKEEMSMRLNIINIWLKDFGLNMSCAKIEICIFHKNSSPRNRVNVEGGMVESTDSIDILGVEWCNTIKKSNRYLHAMKMMKKYSSRVLFCVRIFPKEGAVCTLTFSQFACSQNFGC
jgi:hypothetical protein